MSSGGENCAFVLCFSSISGRKSAVRIYPKNAAGENLTVDGENGKPLAEKECSTFLGRRRPKNRGHAAKG